MNLSSPLTYAYGLHKNSITLLCPTLTDNVHIYELENILPTIILEKN